MSEEVSINVEQVEFMTLIASFVTSGMMALGKIPNPITNKMEKNLDQAKYSIDILIMLKEKTKGNLTNAEDQVLSNAIADMQINFIQEQGACSSQGCSCQSCDH
jgi:hypothetical protein